MSAPADPGEAAALVTRDIAALTDAQLQALMAAAVKSYGLRAEDKDTPLAVFPPDSGVTATEAMFAVSAILKAVNVQVFELGMWQSWSGR